MIQEYCAVRVSSSLRLAIPASNVEQILQLRSDEIAPVPGVISAILGAVNQKGKLLWVLNFERFLKLKVTPLGSSFLAVVISDRDCRVACSALSIEGLLTLDDRQLIRLPTRLPSLPKKLFRGIAKTDTHPHAVLEPQALFLCLNPEST
jgi:purine-binding chemotaxis protein CheW